MKKWMLILLTCLLTALPLSSCGRTPPPEKALAKMMDHLAKGNVSKAEQYLWEGSLNLSSKNRYAKKLYKTMFQSISYAISESSTDGDTAEVTVTITMIDMETIVSEASLEALESAFTGVLGNNKKFYTLVTEKAQSPEAIYITSTATVYMVQEENGSWKISLTDSDGFADAISGGVSALIGY